VEPSFKVIIFQVLLDNKNKIMYYVNGRMPFSGLKPTKNSLRESDYLKITLFPVNCWDETSFIFLLPFPGRFPRISFFFNPHRLDYDFESMKPSRAAHVG
jgi:hypothetical protein